MRKYSWSVSAPKNVLIRYMEWICRLDTSRVQVYSDAAIPLWDSELRPNSVLFLPILILPYQQQDRLEEVLETGDKVVRFAGARVLHTGFAKNRSGPSEWTAAIE